MDSDYPTRAAALFAEIKSTADPVAFLRNLVASRAYEKEIVDFKSGGYLQARPDDLRPLWGKVLSCFANSDGGVVIFGIDAPDGFAKSNAPVEDVRKLVADLKKHLPTVTEPPVSGVDIEPFEDPAGSNKGFVVCYIPMSVHRPHQVRLEGQPHQFYMRAADNCVPCSMASLRALFAPQTVSKLRLCYRVESRSHPIAQWHQVFVYAWLENDGPATASEVYVTCQHVLPGVPPYPFGWRERRWEVVTDGEGGVNAAIAKWPIHPKQSVHLCNWDIGQRHLVWEKERTVVSKVTISPRNQAPIWYQVEVTDLKVREGFKGEATLLESPE